MSNLAVAHEPSKIKAGWHANEAATTVAEASLAVGSFGTSASSIDWIDGLVANYPLPTPIHVALAACHSRSTMDHVALTVLRTREARQSCSGRWPIGLDPGVHRRPCSSGYRALDRVLTNTGSNSAANNVQVHRLHYLRLNRPSR